MELQQHKSVSLRLSIFTLKRELVETRGQLMDRVFKDMNICQELKGETQEQVEDLPQEVLENPELIEEMPKEVLETPQTVEDTRVKAKYTKVFSVEAIQNGSTPKHHSKYKQQQ